MKHLFHPIIGDTTYGDGVHNRYFRQEYGAARLLLAAVSLKVRHPGTGLPLTVSSPPEASFADVLQALTIDTVGLFDAASDRGDFDGGD